MNVKNITQIRVIIILLLIFSFVVPASITAESWSVSPAYEDHVSGSASLTNMESFAEESKLSIKAVGDGPAQVSYMISISPINGTDAAIGTVRTDFRGSVLEARGRGQNASARNEWRDKSVVSGYIKNFMKSFSYTSGLTI